MKRKRLIALMLTLIFIVAAFVGCTSQEDTTAPTGKTTLPAETTGGTVTSGREQLGYNPGKGMPDRIVPGTVLHASYLGQDFPQHLPWGASSRTDIYDTLFTPYQGDYSDIRGNLVTDWKFADDGLSITMQVKQGLPLQTGTRSTQRLFAMYSPTATHSALLRISQKSKAWKPRANTKWCSNSVPRIRILYPDSQPAEFVIPK